MTVETRCPHCGAALRPDAPWCTLCYADLRPAPVVPVAAAPAPAPAPVVAAVPSGKPGWPCTACGTPNDVERGTCATCGLPFLAGLRESEPPLLELPVVGDLTKLSRGQRFALAGGVVLACVLLTSLLGLILG